MTLTSTQKKIIESPAPDIGIAAGPGSGKTTVLVRRVGSMIDQGWRAGITIITFTNAAANEIVARLRGQNEGVQIAYAGTLHGWALRLLREHGHEINMPKTISVLSEDDAKAMLKAHAEGQKVKCTLEELNAATAMGPAFYLGGDAPTLMDAGCVAASYFREQIQSGVVDFDSLLKFAVWIMEKKGGYHVPCLFWDEAQDSGGDDWRIMRLMRTDYRMVVGDPDQSIYGFRGARPDLFNNHFRSMPMAVDDACEVKYDNKFYLEENFRCSPEICAAANSLIQWNKDRLPKTTTPVIDKEPGEGVIVCTCQDPDQELEAIARELRRAPDLAQCAVLVRYDLLVKQIAKGLSGYSIPLAVNAKVDRPKDWADARAYITLLSNPRNDVLMYWWLVRKNGKGSADALKLHCLQKRVPIVSILERQHLFPSNPQPSELPGLMAGVDIGQESIVAVQKAAATLPAGSTLADLSIALTDEDIHRKQEGSGVVVTTIHSAKGREWDTVILPAFEEEIIPTAASIKKGSVDEERRLAFVAFTRARKKLVVINCRTRPPLWGRGSLQDARPSRFIDEANLRTIGQ
jgi:DNA helicase II / ATP-dependent DNA helicase PcrA